MRFRRMGTWLLALLGLLAGCAGVQSPPPAIQPPVQHDNRPVWQVEPAQPAAPAPVKLVPLAGPNLSFTILYPDTWQVNRTDSGDMVTITPPAPGIKGRPAMMVRTLPVGERAVPARAADVVEMFRQASVVNPTVEWLAYPGARAAYLVLWEGREAGQAVQSLMFTVWGSTYFAHVTLSVAPQEFPVWEATFRDIARSFKPGKLDAEPPAASPQPACSGWQVNGVGLGMEQAKVQSSLGTPDSRTSDPALEEWQYERDGLRVTFQHGKVVLIVAVKGGISSGVSIGDSVARLIQVHKMPATDLGHTLEWRYVDCAMRLVARVGQGGVTELQMMHIAR